MQCHSRLPEQVFWDVCLEAQFSQWGTRGPRGAARIQRGYVLSTGRKSLRLERSSSAPIMTSKKEKEPERKDLVRFLEGGRGGGGGALEEEQGVQAGVREESTVGGVHDGFSHVLLFIMNR
jgi:hypothetical protein